MAEPILERCDGTDEAGPQALQAGFGVRKDRAGDRLYGQLLERIVSGELAQGSRLPSENELSAVFGVSRAVVREALTRLQADGLTSARQGVGTFVLRRPPPDLIRLAAPRDISAILACFEARMALECEAAALAALRRLDTHLATMSAALDDMKTGIGERRPAIDADLRFHRTLALASGNDCLVTLLDALHGNTMQWLHIVLNITAHHKSPDRSVRVFDEHLRILEAVTESDPERARMLMRYHLDQARAASPTIIGRRRMVDPRWSGMSGPALSPDESGELGSRTWPVALPAGAGGV